MPRAFIVAACFAVLLGISSTATAQEATPVTGSPTAEASLLAGLGFPDLVVTTDGATASLPDEVAAGRYRLVVENSSDQLSADLLMGLPPEGMSAADAIAEFEASFESEDFGFPELFHEMTFVGGAYALPATAGDAIVTLGPGEYVVNMSTYSETEDLPGANILETLNVTGDLPEVEDPTADVSVTMLEMAFEMPDSIPAGPHIWSVTNTGAFSHFMIIDSYPTPVTPEQIEATLGMFMGTPAATPEALLNPDDFIFVGQGQTLSTGQTNWYDFDLAPGQYIAFCFASGPGEVPLHATLGMYKIFTVE